MSYSQTMKWNTKHRKGTSQPLILSTGSGLWLSGAFLRDEYKPYTDACLSLGVDPVTAARLYQHVTTTKLPRCPEGYAAMTAAGNLL
jgi:hypothetical protein